MKAGPRVLVTGSTGFLGQHTVRALAASGHEVISTSRAAAGPPEATSHVVHDFAAASKFPDIGPIDAVVHLAGDGNVRHAYQDHAAVARLNAQGTLAALQIACRGEASFLLASSQRVYQPRSSPLDEDAPKSPIDPYGYTKLAAELYVEMAGRIFGVRGAILRFFTVYGPGQAIDEGESGVVAILGARATAGAPMVVMSRQEKDFVEVSDAVDAILRAIARPSAPPRPYNIGTAVPTTVLELARALRTAATSVSDIVEVYAESDSESLVADTHRAAQELGYQPRTTLKEGLRRYVEWLRAARPYPA